MRETHQDQIERWAEFVRNNPDKWRKIHTQFINSLFQNHQRVYKELSKTKEGRKKLIEIYDIKNLEGFPSLKD